MQRQPLYTGGWFDLDAATKYEEGRRWDGSNHISLATGSQWDHECLYRTRSGRWVLHHWSQRQGSGDSWREIDDAAAAQWLVANEHDPDQTDAASAAAELER